MEKIIPDEAGASEGQKNEEPAFLSARDLFRAGLLTTLLAVPSGCASSSVAHGGGVTVTSGPQGTQVVCQPSYASGPNAKAGKATATVNGKTYECQEDGTVIEKK